MDHKTTREELLALHVETCYSARKIMESKNTDYGATTDALRNFRLCENLMVPVGVGIITRLGDKLARIAKIVVTGTTAVMDETVEDTIMDAINYLVILRAWIHEQKAV
jgi:hypothetical protein